MLGRETLLIVGFTVALFLVAAFLDHEFNWL